METFFGLIVSLLEKLSLKRVALFGLLVAFLVGGYFLYFYTPVIGDRVLSNISSRELRVITPAAEKAIDAFMTKHSNTAVYLTVLKFNFHTNTRTPIYRSFNNDDVKKIIFERLKGGDGSLPLFIRDDVSNNDQMISIIQGETVCDPFSAGGLARVWPDLSNRFEMSCRVPVPPAFGGGVRGYIVVHSSRMLKSYELETFRLDLKLLATQVNNTAK